MARIKLHDDIYGHKSGESIDVSQSKADWAVANGYASTSGDDTKLIQANGVPAGKDQTLAKNREAPNKGLQEQIADGDLLKADPDKDTDDVQPTLNNLQPIELTNGKGDPAKAARGKDALEAKADQADPGDAPEVSGEPTEPVKPVPDPEKVAAKQAEADNKATGEDAPQA
jgi:hypothetical protein